MDNRDKFEVIKQEYKKWNWLLNYPHTLEQLNAYSAFFRFFSEIDIKDNEATFNSDLNAQYIDLTWEVTQRHEFLLSLTKKGKFVDSLQDKEVAASTLLAFINGIDKDTEGAIQALLFKKGLKQDIRAEKVKFEELLNRFRIENTKLSGEFANLNNQLSNELRRSQQATIELQSECSALCTESEKQKQAVLDIEEIKNHLDSTLRLELENKIKHASENYDESIKSLHQKLNEEEEIVKKRYDSFVDAYENQMKLKAPVQYWSDNCIHHKEAADKFGIASIILSLLIFLPIAYVAWEILASSQVVWGKVGVVAFTTSLAIWLIRILVRMYLSHNHMLMNSQERVVMTQAYLALISEGGASSSEERNLVLGAIFRPVSTGIVTDDAAPNNIIELLTKARK